MAQHTNIRYREVHTYVLGSRFICLVMSRIPLRTLFEAKLAEWQAIENECVADATCTVG